MRSTDRRLRLAVPVALAGVLLGGSLSWQAAAQPDDTPTRDDVRRAERAATDARRDVAAVRTDLVLANQRAEQASVRAAAAYEAWSAARWEFGQAKQRAAEAAAAEQQARSDLADRRAELDALLASQYESAPALSALSAIAGEDGIDGVLTQANTYYGTTTAIRDLEAAEGAAAELAELATDDAEQASAEAERLAARTERTRREARQAEQAALTEAQAVARQKESLVAELARLQGVSVSLAARRQGALEERARVRARRAAEREAEEQAKQEPATPAPDDADDGPISDPAPDPQPDPSAPPVSSGSAAAAIAFAKAQIGDRYVWGAAGPDAWDCSGLTMAAWQRGGKALPHYSVGQYAASTPIAPGDLRPGDLVFWGTSSNPSSIHHVALYVGNGQIVHAPRTGRPVTQESMYYWIPPNFFARP